MTLNISCAQSIFDDFSFRSLLAHDDSVTSVKFQPETHYFFSCGKDGVVKYWDADRFILYCMQ